MIRNAEYGERRHRRQAGGYGAEMYADHGVLIIRCCLCDWTDAASPIQTETEQELYAEWRIHRMKEHAH